MHDHVVEQKVWKFEPSSEKAQFVHDSIEWAERYMYEQILQKTNFKNLAEFCR